MTSYSDFKCVGNMSDPKDAYVAMCALCGATPALAENWDEGKFSHHKSIVNAGGMVLNGRYGHGNYAATPGNASLGYIHYQNGTWYIFVRMQKVEKWGEWEFYAQYPNSSTRQFNSHYDHEKNAIIIQRRNLETTYE